MDLPTGPPPGLSRPKSSRDSSGLSQSPSASPLPLSHPVVSPVPRRPQSASWASSLTAGLFPPTFDLPLPAQVPQGIQPLSEAVRPAELLPQPLATMCNNTAITDLAVFPAPLPSDPWHMAHARVCIHAYAACAACSVAFVCCSCRALRFTPGSPPTASQPPSERPGPPQRSRSASPALFRLGVGNGTPPPGFDSHHDTHDDYAYAQAMADSDTCDNSACPRGADEPATWTITVEQFDEGTEEHFDRTFRACGACNCSCKCSFLGHKIRSRVFDNSTREALTKCSQTPRRTELGSTSYPIEHPVNPATKNIPSTRRSGPVPGSTSYARDHPTGTRDHLTATTTTGDNASAPTSATVPAARYAGIGAPSEQPREDDGNNLHQGLPALQDALRALGARPPTPAAFVATIRVKHDVLCTHSVTSCPSCSCGLVCCSCKHLFTPAVARHLACKQCQHVAYSCCQTAFCCKCGKPWLPSNSVLPHRVSSETVSRVPARRFYGGAGSGTATTSSPEPDIWTPSPRSSPDEIDNLTARAAIPLPTSRSESDTSRAPSRASSVDEPVNVAATPLPTPNYSSISDDAVDGLIHPSFPDRAILDATDKRHFLGRGDLSVTSLKLYARRIFSETSHWITAGHFLIDIFQGSTLNGSRDDFRRFVILVGTQLGFGDLALSMSESLDVNRKMADEYMRLRDVATTWKQKAKANSKDAKMGRKAQDELNKAQGDITLILEERDVFIKQRNELLAEIKRLNLELSRVHKDYGNTIDDNTNYAANIESLE